MFKGAAGIGGLMKQAQKMQENMKNAQAQLAEMEHEGVASSGLVTVQMNGAYAVRRVHIDASLLGSNSTDDQEMLEDLIALAVNDAVRKIEAASSEKMAGFSAGLPPGFKLPF